MGINCTGLLALFLPGIKVTVHAHGVETGFKVIDDYFVVPATEKISCRRKLIPHGCEEGISSASHVLVYREGSSQQTSPKIGVEEVL